jgi:hypothetical protein
MTRLIRAGIVLDALALALFLGSFAYARVVLPLAASRYVVALDRAQVFCEDNLRAFDPTLAENLRHNVGPFVTQDHQRTIEFVLILAIALTVVRLMLLVILRRTSARARGAATGQHNTGCAGPGAA